nr:retrovirus-related Pol polyprotein LINE-1 [Tanacetum cinerariifolium]
ISSAKVPEEWRLSEVILNFKNKGDAQVCSNYRGIKLLGHTMKLWKRVIKRRLRRESSVSENQFGFMPGRSSVEAIHLIRSLIEKYRERLRDLHMAFLDLENDSVPWELIWETLVDKGTSMRYNKVIRDMYDVSESIESLNIRLENWREALEDNGLRVSREKTKYVRCDSNNKEITNNEEVDVCIGDKILQPKESFRYLGSMLHKSERIDEDASNRIKAARRKRRPQSAPVRRVEALVVDGLRRRGRPKLKWEDRVKHDIKELLLSEDMTSDRNE